MNNILCLPIKWRALFFMILFWFCSFGMLLGQDTVSIYSMSDTTLARIYLDKALIMIDSSNYKEAVNLCHKSPGNL
jgi:hypothetical protein